MFDEERTDYFQQIKELEAASGNYQQIKKEFDMRTVFTKWLYVAKLRTIRSLDQGKAQATVTAEKQAADREFTLFLHKNPQIDLKQELQDAKNEIADLCQIIGDLKYEQYVSELAAN